MKKNKKRFYTIYELIKDNEGKIVEETNLWDFSTLKEVADYLHKPISTIKTAKINNSIIDTKYRVYQFMED